jgi:hypothetical protein
MKKRDVKGSAAVDVKTVHILRLSNLLRGLFDVTTRFLYTRNSTWRTWCVSQTDLMVGRSVPKMVWKLCGPWRRSGVWVGPGDGLYAGCFAQTVLRGVGGGPTNIFDQLEKRKSFVPVRNRIPFSRY